MGKYIADRDFLQEPLTGMEFAAFLSAADLGTIYRDKIVLHDDTIYYNMTGKKPNRKQKKDLNEAILNLLDRGGLIGEVMGRGTYLIDCQSSFHYDLKTLPHGGSVILFDNIRKVVTSGQSWQGLLRYYLMVLGHMRVTKACTFSRKYFADKLGMNELTISKYNTILAHLGLLEIKRRMNMSNVYSLPLDTVT